MRPNGLKSSSYLFFIIFAVSMIFSFTSSAQKDPEEQWLQHLVKGDAKKLASFMGSAVAVDLLTQSGTYSKSQTVMVLAEFFGIYPAERVIISQSGITGSTTKFFIGEYECKKITYRLYILMNNTSGEYLIHQLSITKK